MYTLYARKGSGSLAVQVALEEIGASYERVWIDKEPPTVASYRAINPTGKVPALGLPDGRVMFESAAMLIHLALLHPEAGLAPTPGTTEYARFLQWMVFMSANVYEAVLRVYYSARYSARGEADAAAIREQGIADLMSHLALINRELRPFVLGSRYSIADVYLHMLAAWYPGGRAELDARLPELGRHGELVKARPAFAKSDADHAE